MPIGAAPAEVARVLRDVARLGPYFEICTTLDGPEAVWRPLSGDVGRLQALTGDYAERLGVGESRVAGSLVFQGLAARLWSPVVAAAAAGVVPDLGPLRWRWAPGEPIRLGLAEPGGWQAGSLAEAADLVHRVVVDGQLRPLREAMASVVKLADGLVWGNAASALAGSLNVGPVSGTRAELVRALLALEPLAGAGHFGADGFVRNNCCLYYRVPGGGMCGDCGLLTGS
ncbi:(2Fe-2S)-binding protein [Actinomadura bangladeshensis]|uniref:(2Fe-2S)-binding protein n=1 Tax=Actinomadura bangladeshensis TaxID=453573 RepID=A0A4R4NX35_9ACTN|nr:(2Fe-2S)-binding protein [Actinomadura bangladeshensis]TDC13674.1 (2Fe-2S)-binding protein [Actinomadura bangladeshensis]